MSTTNTGAHYGTGLARVMADRQVSIRGLARRLDPADPENARRAIRRYLSGDQTPTVKTRERIAEALDATREEIEGDPPTLPGDLRIEARAAAEDARRAARRMERLAAALLTADEREESRA